MLPCRLGGLGLLLCVADVNHVSMRSKAPARTSGHSLLTRVHGAAVLKKTLRVRQEPRHSVRYTMHEITLYALALVPPET